jgi:hypothetical protein
MHGAKNVIVVSRSANAQKSGPFLVEMAKAGCRVRTVGCDISDEKSLANVLSTCAEDMPPVRGVVQAAMVLQVCAPNMQYTLIVSVFLLITYVGFHC